MERVFNSSLDDRGFPHRRLNLNDKQMGTEVLTSEKISGSTGCKIDALFIFELFE